MFAVNHVFPATLIVGYFLLSRASTKLSLVFAILEEYGIDDDEMLNEEPATLEEFGIDDDEMLNEEPAILEVFGTDGDKMLDEEPAILESFDPSVGELSLQDTSANTTNPKPKYFIFTLTFAYTKIYNQQTLFPSPF